MVLYTLSPFTDQIVALFGFINPVIILTLGWGLFLVGAMVYLFRHAVEEGDVEIGVRKRRRIKVFGVLLMLIGTSLIAPGIDATNTLIQYSSGTNNAGAPAFCTNSTIGTSACSLPANGCDGIYRVGIGRCEKGSNTVTINAGGNSGTSATITFPTPFTNAPQALEIRNRNLGSPQTITVGTATNTLPAFMQSGPTLTWTSMPAALTEIYGDALNQHGVTLDWTQATTFTFCANVVVASTSATSYLTLDYTTDGGGTFNELSAAQRIIPSGTPEPFCGSVADPSQSTQPIFNNIPAGAKTAGVQLVPFGANGGGVGDNPQFTSIYVLYTNVVSVTATVNEIANVVACVSNLNCGAASEASATSFVLKAAFVYNAISSTTITVNWTFWSYTG